MLILEGNYSYNIDFQFNMLNCSVQLMTQCNALDH